jgi:hypothetical protein
VAVGVLAFSWLVVISWDVLTDSVGPDGLLMLLVLAAVTAAAWYRVLARKIRRPAERPLTRTSRTLLGAVSVLAAVTGVVAVPATRAELEQDKCRHLARPDAVAQANCRTWLESRREWWTFGLSHRNPRSNSAN